MRKTTLLAALVAALSLPAATAAQGGPGFMFKNPRVSLGIRTGYQLPRVGSNIFEFPLDSLTLSRSDFGSPWLGGEIAVRVTDNLDVAAGVGWARARSASEYVNWLEGGSPIEQVTTLETINGSLGVKYYFTDRGRSIGRFAWVPSRFTPYVAGGIGFVEYEFTQEGDFVDFESILVDPVDGSVSAEIFTDRLRSSGTGFAGYLAGGIDVTLGRQLVLTGEGRYTLSNGPVSGPYSSFDRIDLAGLQLLAGIGIRF
ncbi:MAG TPA: hypothetical protein VMM35_05960 [Longimicrobiales bacterium]|nr:hypothetical protein [Longimicrobiales bacterium]